MELLMPTYLMQKYHFFLTFCCFQKCSELYCILTNSSFLSDLNPVKIWKKHYEVIINRRDATAGFFDVILFLLSWAYDLSFMSIPCLFLELRHVLYIKYFTRNPEVKKEAVWIWASAQCICSKLQRKLQNNVWNPFQVNNKDIKMTSLTSLWYLYVKFEQISHIVLVSDFERLKTDWINGCLVKHKKVSRSYLFRGVFRT